MSTPTPELAPDALLGALAHELRGPLNVCSMWLELLELNAERPDEVRKAAEVMRRNLAQQAKLIRELDDVARLLGGGIELDKATVDLAALLRGACGRWRAAAAERAVGVVDNLDAGATPVEGDEERLLQALGYCFDNALAATPAGGRVTVRLGRGDDHADCTISDTGEGLDPAERDRFFAAPLSGPRRQKGHGLRLVIARHIIGRHGGSLTIASAGAAHGCTLTVRLPLRGQHR